MTETSIYTHLIRGAAWTVAIRWTMKSIGLLNVIILARLLEPDDFGLMATAMNAGGFVQSFTELGAQQLLFRQQNVDRRHIDSAWTIKILQGFLVAALIVAIAPFASVYFGDERVEAILYVTAFSSVISGTSIIGLIAMSVVLINYGAMSRLVLLVFCGAAVYLGSLFLSWSFAGKPEGIEKIVLQRLSRQDSRSG